MLTCVVTSGSVLAGLWERFEALFVKWLRQVLGRVALCFEFQTLHR